MKVTSNKSQKTFTIKMDGTTYRTNKLSKQEFEESHYNSNSDWVDYIRNSGNVYVVK